MKAAAGIPVFYKVNLMFGDIMLDGVWAMVEHPPWQHCIATAWSGSGQDGELPGAEDDETQEAQPHGARI